MLTPKEVEDFISRLTKPEDNVSAIEEILLRNYQGDHDFYLNDSFPEIQIDCDIRVHILFDSN